uniref:Uncharacterized protein n=1 Tax=Picea glauca TaxID=3330 RepID=A0A101LVW0_PICGL|nr:hypothetical protein ABT39_MTgene1823 [Picea glauca]
MITSRPVRKWAVLGYMSHLITIVSSDKTSPSTIYSSSITSTSITNTEHKFLHQQHIAAIHIPHACLERDILIDGHHLSREVVHRTNSTAL